MAVERAGATGVEDDCGYAALVQERGELGGSDEGPPDVVLLLKLLAGVLQLEVQVGTGRVSVGRFPGG